MIETFIYNDIIVLRKAFHKRGVYGLFNKNKSKKV